MRVNLNRTYFCNALLLTILCLSGSIVFAQNKTEKQTKAREFCSNDKYSFGDKASFKELREMTLPAGNLLTVDGKQNGGILVKGSDRADVLVRACIQTQGETNEAAQSLARNIRIEKSPNIHAESATKESNWAVSYEIHVPRMTNLQLTAHNGGIGITSVEGTINFETTNGGVKLNEVAGNLKGRTTNGGVSVILSGNRWKGSGLDVETTNGGVHLIMPESYAARVETGTVNGGFRSEISSLNVERNDRTNGGRINTVLNGGGAPIRVITTNGGVKISSSNKLL